MHRDGPTRLFARRTFRALRIMPSVRCAAGIGLAYLAVAMLMTHLQPGSFALPVFPPSGIALAALLVYGRCYWPSVGLAGFGFALYSIFQLQGEIDARGFAGAVLVAAGVALEAIVGRWLILKFVGFPTSLDTPRDIGLFLILGGPVACLIGASLSFAGLTSLSIIGPQEWFLHGVGWWLGDSMGVLVGAPLTLILIAHPRAIWRPRLLSVAPLLTLSAALITSLMLQVAPLDTRQHRAAFQQESQRLKGLIQAQLQDAGDWLDWVDHFFDPIGQNPDRAELTQFMQALQQRHPAIRALLWLTPATGGHARQVEPSQWALIYAEPRSDMGSFTGVNAALRESLESLRAVSLEHREIRSLLRPIGNREAPESSEVAVLHPIYRAEGARATDARNAQPDFRGFLVLTLDLTRAEALSRLSERGLRFCLSTPERDTAVAVRAFVPVCPPERRANDFSARYPIELGGQSWTLVVSAPMRSFMREPFGLRASALVLSSLLLAGLFAASLLVLSGNNRRIQEIVLDRTRRLDLSARVFDSTAEGIIITDAENRIISVNPAFTSITGYLAAEVLGHDPRAFGAGEQDSGYFASLWESLTEQGRWQGEIWNRRKSGEIFPAWMTISTARDVGGKVLNYIATFTDISQQKQAAEHIHHLAYFDALTGLANRSLLELRGEQAIGAAEAQNHMLAVLFLDVDRFKTINDSLGHLAGDQLLQTIAERLRRSIRDEDTVARLGGDEFVVLLAELSRREDSAIVARKILDTLALPTRIENQELSVTASIGISFYPYDGQDFPSLVKNADVALYKAKEEGRNNFQFFEAAMSAHSFERLVLEIALRGALDRDELILYFQPQVNIATGLVVGAEALLRWKHPQMGLIAPNRFIRLAEESGMIAAIGEWVIRTVCRSLARWEAEGVPCTTIAVNISALQFKHDLAEMVQKALDESGVSPGLLEMELTESLLMSSADESVKTLKKLHRLGVRLSIDDFGTGYSSLSYLKRFPIHKLKIDQSFIREIPGDSNDEAITRTIIGLANNLHLRVVAEGVETQAQSDFLYSVGCHEIQGSHVARPMPAAEFASWMSDRGKRRYPLV